MCSYELAPIAICRLPPEVGLCNTNEVENYHKRWYYSDSRGSCVSFIYSGCMGNQNNFRSFDSCTQFCASSKLYCTPPNLRNCVCLQCRTQYAIFWTNEHDTTNFLKILLRKCLPLHFLPISRRRDSRRNAVRMEAKHCLLIDFVVSFTGTDDENAIEDGERTDPCKSRYEACNALHCPYGITRTYDQDHCERCECENPCRNYRCPDDSQCAVDLQPDPQDGSSFVPVCRQSKRIESAVHVSHLLIFQYPL